MQTLRQAHHIARGVLLWFALSLGVAIASPLVQPQDLRLVCSAAGALKVITVSADGQTSSNPSLDCPLCAGLAGPPPLDYCGGTAAAPLGYALPWQTPPGHAPARATPPPARGPPVHA